MTEDSSLVPASSQTVGPFFCIGLDYLIERAPAVEEAGKIQIQGQVLDRDGAPVPDAVLEFWTPGVAASGGYPAGFRRTGTDVDGNFSTETVKPTGSALENGRMQAPHLLVLIFARGLLRHLLTRVYFEDEPGNANDPVLGNIPAARRGTLMAQLDNQTNSYRWNVILQGQNETVFFAW